MPPAFPLYSCRANAMHFIFAFSPSVYWPRFLSTRHPSLSVSYEVHLKCHLLFEVFASFQDSKWFWVYSRPQSTCPSLRASPGGSLILPFLSFPTRFGAPGGQELILGIFFFLMAPQVSVCQSCPTNSLNPHLWKNLKLWGF